MILAVVKGNVVSTNKTEKLQGGKLLIVEEWNVDTKKASGQPRVALDLVGAGEGELVMCVCGSSARQTEETDKRPVDMAIIGIVDQAEMNGVTCYKKYRSAEEKAAEKAPEKPASHPAQPKPAEAAKPVAAKPAERTAPTPAAPQSEPSMDDNRREAEKAAERFRQILSASNEQLRSADAAAQTHPKAKKPAPGAKK